MVVVQDLTKRYTGKRTVHALQRVSFRVERHEFVAIMGPSGSGKSTLLNIIGGLDRPSEGSVRIDGQELHALNDHALTRMRRDKIGFVFQFFNLLPTLTAWENVALPLHLVGMSRKEARAKAVARLERVGLKDRQDHLPDELSGGEQQRVAIARALILNPPLILADEPTGNLDSKTGQEVLTLLKGLQDQFDITVIMVTHDPQVAAFCHRTMTMQDGQLVQLAQVFQHVHAAPEDQFA
jgi:putative ABC transport system ATP-binding protein